MAAYTLLQLIEVAVASVLLLVGVLWAGSRTVAADHERRQQRLAKRRSA